MRRVVSVSLGTSKRNKSYQLDILGERFQLDRIGTDGDKRRFAALMRELDGQVDALGVGGADLVVVAGERRYTFRDVQRMVAGVRKTPVVDGNAVKHTLEREAIRRLASDRTLDFATINALLVSAVDRYGMAQALAQECPNVVYGDLLFGLGVPIKLTRYESVARLGALLLPLITRCPIEWFYPTGEKQEERRPKFGWAFSEADLICGDWHYIRRYAPDSLPGKTVLTQTLRQADLQWLRQAGVARAITTTPVMGGETFATNVIEGVLVSLIGKPPADIGAQEYLAKLGELGWSPNVIDLGRHPAIG